MENFLFLVQDSQDVITTELLYACCPYLGMQHKLPLFLHFLGVIESCHYKTSDNSWRSFFEKTFLDILYYMSQIFSEEVRYVEITLYDRCLISFNRLKMGFASS